MRKKRIFSILLVIFFGHLLFRIWLYKDNYVSTFDSVYWTNRYLHSQWVTPVGCSTNPHINPVTCVWDDSWYAKHKDTYQPQQESIGDDGLYAYAGWEYVNGKDPTLLNAEMPPFGKYLIGVSILIFRNQNIFALLSGILALSALYLLSRHVIKNTLFALLPVLFFSIEPLFYTQLRAPFLDLFYLALLCFTFYFFLKRKFVFSFVALGLMMATKASIATMGLVMVTEGVYLLFNRDVSSLKRFIFLSPITILVFLTTYVQYFLLGHTVRQFLGVQKWILTFYASGAKGNIIDIFQMIFVGKWFTWWEKTGAVVNEWQITWPLLFFSFILTSILMLKKRKKDHSLLLHLWVVVYITFLMVVPVFPRYLLAALPFLYILFVKVVFQFISKYKNT